MAFLDEHGLEYYTSKIKEYIGKQVGQAVGEVTQFRFEVVTELPETGEVGVIYLKSLTGSEANNVYDEFIWVGTNFEFLGTTETDLTGYATETWVVGQVDGHKTEVTQQLASKQDLLTPGENITIENNVISAKIPSTDLSGLATKAELESHTTNNDIHVTSDEKEVWNTISSIPTEQNELIYSLDGETYSAQPLMYTEGLVVDTEEDLNLCKATANVSMNDVITTWNVFGNNADDKGKWGYCDATGTDTQTVTLKDGTTQSVPVFTYNGSKQSYIFNTKNTSALTGYYSEDSYSDYDSKTAIGIIEQLQQENATDYMAIVPALNDTDGLCGISISVNNTNGTGQEGREQVPVGTTHTISVIAWKQSSPDLLINSATSADTTNVQLLTNTEGLSIIPYNSVYCNGTAAGTASSMQVLIKRRGNKITFWSSEAYATADDDYAHRNDIHYKRPIEIDLQAYTLTFTDKDGVTTVKNFADDANVVEIFGKLQGSAKRGYEVLSNPGSVFRNCSEDEVILNVITDQDKVYRYNGEAWVEDTTVTPLDMFKVGSRLSWNRVTKKLFYNDGFSIYCVANLCDGETSPSSSNYVLPTASATTLGGIKVGNNLTIENGVLSVAGDFTGTPGESLQYNWEGTKLGVKTTSETDYTYVDLKGGQGIQGPKGEQGIQGEQGPAGESITITATTSSTEDGGANTVTFSDGTVLTVYNGKTGSDVPSTSYEEGQNISIQDGEISALGYTYEGTEFGLGTNTLTFGADGVNTIKDEQNTLKIYGDHEVAVVSDNSLQMTSTGDMSISSGGALTINADSNVNIINAETCTIDAATTLTKGLNVTGAVNASEGFFQTSDIAKKNVVSELDLNKAYDLVDKCQAILYTLKEDAQNTVQIGLIAQEVQEIFPELVTVTADGSLALDYSRLTVVILRVLKDLIVRIQNLESK